ncbi:MAG: hypothetical protein KY445_06340 [Armatimonadetes bacterium]|nr:hypothetical protein [Armatimonadota bacterium]
MNDETTTPEYTPPTHKVGRNKKGEVELTPIDDAAPQSGAASAQHSFFEDDQGDNLASGVVLLNGQKVMVRELSASEMAAYSQGEKEIAEMLRALSDAKDNETAEAQADAIKERQMALYDAAIEAGVSSWELKRPNGEPVPCTPEFKRKLRISKKVELSEKIVRRSATGRDMDAFLGGS